MKKRPFIIRKWTDGPRPATRTDEGGPGTFDNEMFPEVVGEVEPAAGQRYRDQLDNKTLQIHRVVTSEETDYQYGVWYVRFTEGSDFPNHLHERSQASIMVVEGEGYVILDGERFSIQAGDVVHIPPGVAHEFFAGRKGETFAYVSITQPDIVGFEVKRENFERDKVDWKSMPSNRYTPDGDVREV